MTARRALVVAALSVGCASRPAPVVPPTPHAWTLPPFMVEPTVPADNPMTEEAIALGRHLFYDPLLSQDGGIACASCHQQAHGFSDPRAKSLGVGGQVGRRNSMALFNLAWSDRFFWDGRAPTLEDQVLIPIQDPKEMARDLDTLVADLKASDRYPPMFRAAFGEAGISADTVAKALAQFVRTLVSFDSPWDHFDENQPERTFRNDAQLRGWMVFMQPFPLGDPKGVLGLCNDCHDLDHGVRKDWNAHYAGTFTTSELRHDGMVDPADAGAFEVTGREEDRGKFKVPSLRNILHTGPYMHDGRFATLREVLEHYNEHIVATPTTDAILMRDGEALTMNLTSEQIDDVVAFFELFDDATLRTNPAWSSPFADE